MFKHIALRDIVKLQYYIEFSQRTSLLEAAELLNVNSSTIYRELSNIEINKHINKTVLLQQEQAILKRNLSQ